MIRLVVEQSLVEDLEAATAAPLAVLSRGRAGRRSGGRRRGAWRPLSQEAALEALLEDPDGAVVLARPPDADPGAACLPAAAAVLGIPIVRLPAALDAAAWIVGVASEWSRRAEPDLARRLEALVGAAEAAGASSLPRRAWGVRGTAVPALRPAALARWAGCAWTACGWCRTGGGLAGRPCGRCGAPVPPPAAPGPGTSP